jgi:hypothetical protein
MGPVLVRQHIVETGVTAACMSDLHVRAEMLSSGLCPTRGRCGVARVVVSNYFSDRPDAQKRGTQQKMPSR